MSQAASTVVSLAIALVVLVRIVQNQVRTRPVDAGLRAVLVLTVVGVIQVSEVHVPLAAYGVFALALASGALFGALRGVQVDVRRTQQGGAVRSGNLVTVGLFLAGLGVHLLIDHALGGRVAGAADLGATGMLLYLAVTLGVQRQVVLVRARQLPA